MQKNYLLKLFIINTLCFVLFASNQQKDSNKSNETSTKCDQEVFEMLDRDSHTFSSGGLKRCLKEININTVVDNKKKATPLIYYIGRHSGPDSDRLEILLDNGANPNLKNNGRLALNLAIQYKHGNAVGLLIKYGADVNAKDDKDRLPIDLAFDNKNLMILVMLLSNGAKLTDKILKSDNKDKLVTIYKAALYADDKTVIDEIAKKLSAQDIQKAIKETNNFDNIIYNMTDAVLYIHDTKLIDKIYQLGLKNGINFGAKNIVQKVLRKKDISSYDSSQISVRELLQEKARLHLAKLVEEKNKEVEHLWSWHGENSSSSK